MQRNANSQKREIERGLLPLPIAFLRRSQGNSLTAILCVAEGC